MAEHTYKFNVAMSCGGCSGAVERVLKKLDGKSGGRRHRSALQKLRTQLTRSIGVKSYNVSLETQTAEIVAEDSLGYETVLEKIKKTGKKVNSGEADGQPQEV
jgi:copper chaperone